LAFSIYLISCGAYTEHPSLADHLKVVPPALAAGALPLAPGGLGYQEAALAKLFETLPNMPVGYSGMLVATIYRLVTIVIAGFGLPFYWTKQTRDVQLETAQDGSGH
jgi:glycosyltransferase 2 family protein